jgi:hypothetical protein
MYRFFFFLLLGLQLGDILAMAIEDQILAALNAARGGLCVMKMGGC